MLSQAEHDELASSILLTTSLKMARAVAGEVRAQTEALRPIKRKKVAEKSIASFGLIVVVKDLTEAADISNKIAPEHLELFVEKPLEILEKIKNAGAIFLGKNTPEATGDYMAGPNHTLPTGGTARFSSPLGVYDFQKRTSIIGFCREGIKALGPDISRFAKTEGLTAHSDSVKQRLSYLKKR
jgi:histidinol dehydrogenase